jgi:hypothetical protein
MYFEDYHANWADFLSHSVRVFEKVKKGAVAKQRTKSFWASEKKLRKEDPLRQWVHQARNVEHHGLQSSIEHVLGRVTAHFQKGDVITKSETYRVRAGDLKKDGGEWDYSAVPEDRVKIVPATAKLLTVADDRFGDTFDPPTEHLGRPISPTVPDVCAAMLDYHSALIWRAFQEFSKS